MAEASQRGSAARPRNVIIRAYETKKHDGWMLRVDNFQAIARKNLASNPNILANPRLNPKNVFVSNEYMSKLVAAAHADYDVLSFHHENGHGTLERDMLANVKFDRTGKGELVPRPDSLTSFVSASKHLGLQDQARLIGVDAIDEAHLDDVVKGFAAMCEQNAKIGEAKREALSAGATKQAPARPAYVASELTRAMGSLPAGEYVARQMPGSSQIEVTRWQGSVGLNDDGTFKSEGGKAYASVARQHLVGDLGEALPAVGGHGGSLEGKGSVVFFESDGKGSIGVPTVKGREDNRTGKWLEKRSPEENMKKLLGAYDKSMAVREAKIADAPVVAPAPEPVHMPVSDAGTPESGPMPWEDGPARKAGSERAAAHVRQLADFDGPDDDAGPQAEVPESDLEDLPF